MDLSATRVNPDLEKDGVWNQIDLETDILVARWMNPIHAAFIRKRAKPLQQAMKMDALSEEAENDLRIKSMVECILLDWRGMKADGKDQPYSKEAALKVLSDPQLSWFTDMVETFSRDLSMYKIETDFSMVEDIKKS